MTTKHNTSGQERPYAKRIEQYQIPEYDRDKVLKEIVDGNHCSPSPRNLFAKANQYVPTRVRAASVVKSTNV